MTSEVVKSMRVKLEKGGAQELTQGVMMLSRLAEAYWRKTRLVEELMVEEPQTPEETQGHRGAIHERKKQIVAELRSMEKRHGEQNLQGDHMLRGVSEATWIRLREGVDDAPSVGRGQQGGRQPQQQSKRAVVSFSVLCDLVDRLEDLVSATVGFWRRQRRARLERGVISAEGFERASLSRRVDLPRLLWSAVEECELLYCEADGRRRRG